MKKLILAFMMAFAVVTFGAFSSTGTYAAPSDKAAPHQCEDPHTTVPGHCNKDSGNVTGHYYSVYAEDGNGDYYWDLGDGSVYTAAGISSIDDLDQETLTVCNYIINYRGDFGDDPFLDMGSIQNVIKCDGPDGRVNYMYMIVHVSDPRFDPDGIDVGWGPDWRAHFVESGVGSSKRNN